MKRIIFVALLLIGICLFSGCDKECEHNWQEASCTNAKICSKCDLTEGNALGHTWNDATCTLPKTCSVCNITDGAALGHTWNDATCTTPKTCAICALTDGSPLAHEYTETITKQATCQSHGTKKYSCKNCDAFYEESYAFPEYTPEQLYNLIKQSSGEIITYGKNGSELALGSGFVYSSDGKIITNYHVIEDAFSAKITINEIDYTIEKVLAYDKTIDLAVLKINATGLSTLPLCNEAHAVGKNVYAFGSSKGLTATFSQGIITRELQQIDGVFCVQHDAAISSGNSGGPLVNSYGEIIGINSWTLVNAQNLNFAVSTKELNNLTYGTPLTLPEFYEKECDPFLKMKAYIIENGTYDTEDQKYTVILGTNIASSGTIYTRKAYYFAADDEIQITLFSNAEYLVTVVIDEVDGIYSWDYYDHSGYFMTGTLYATTYNNNSLVGYNYVNTSYSSLITSIRKLASSMMALLCTYLDNDLSPIGLCAEDLGFLNY